MPTPNSTRLARRILAGVWLTLLVGLLLMIGISHAIGLSGRQQLIIRGGSMEPTIPLGSLIAVSTVTPESLRPGDVITLRTTSGVPVTHRLTDIIHGADGELRLLTKGDANATADQDPWTVGALIGRVDFWLPFVGFPLSYLGLTTGMISVLCGMASLLLAIWLLDDDLDGSVEPASPIPTGA